MTTQQEPPGTLEICNKILCSPETMKLASEQPTPSDFVTALQDKKLYFDAVQFISRFLPKEKAVQWAMQSAKLAGDQTEISSEEQSVLSMVEKWLTSPTTANGKEAATAAADLPVTSPAYWGAQAAAFAEGVEMPEGELPLDGSDDLTGHFVAGAVQLSAAKLSPDGLPDLSEMPTQPDRPLEITGGLGSLMTQTTAQEPPSSTAAAETATQLIQTSKYLMPFIKLGVALAKTVPGWI